MDTKTYFSLHPSGIHICMYNRKNEYTEHTYKNFKKENNLINLLEKYAFLLGVCWEVLR